MNDGGPAFPHEPGALVNDRAGMTLRDYFAAKAMQAYIRKVIIKECPDDVFDQYIAKSAYDTADAMLAAREAKP